MFYKDEYVLPEEKFLTERYRRLRDKVFTIYEKDVKYQKSLVVVNEKILRAIWYDQKLERRGMKTLDGKRVAILNPGQWNLDSGPDFLQASMRLDNEIIDGDIEIDLRGSDWEKHNHHTNQQYNNVILHIIFTKDSQKEPFVTKSSNEKVPQLEIRPYLHDDNLYIADVEEYPFCSVAGIGACGKKIKPKQYPLLEHIITWAGDMRMIQKTRQFADRLKTENIDQIFYSAVMESLGYKENKIPMRQLSDYLTWNKICQLVKQIETNNPALIIQTILFYISGLLPEKSYFAKSDTETKMFGNEIYKIVDEYNNKLPRQLSGLEWKYKGVRPANYPLRRLAGASYFLANGIKWGLFSQLQDIINNIETKTTVALVDEFISLFFSKTQDYFLYRTGFGTKKTKHKYSLIGNDRAHAIMVNVIFPILNLWSENNEGFTGLKKTICQMYKEMPVLTGNRIARQMFYRILGPEKLNNFPIDTERKQQGLLQIYHDFCSDDKNDCSNCLFPKIFDMSWGEIVKFI